MIKKILVFLFIFSSLNATQYSIEKLKKEENSLAKDYYIYRLLEKNKISKKDAQDLKFKFSSILKREQVLFCMKFKSLFPKGSFTPLNKACMFFSSMVIRFP